MNMQSIKLTSRRAGWKHSLEGALPQAQQAQPLHSKLPAGPRLKEAVIQLDSPFPWETSWSGSCQVSNLCSPTTVTTGSLASCHLGSYPGTLDVPSTHWTSHLSHLPILPVWPLEPCGVMSKAPSMSHCISKPYLITPTERLEGILEIWNSSVRTTGYYICQAGNKPLAMKNCLVSCRAVRWLGKL
jgi:hypothetical protein